MKVNDIVFVVLNGSIITKAEILKKSGNLYNIKFGGKVIRLPKHRLFKTEEDARNSISNYYNKVIEKRGFRPPDLH